MKKLFSFFVLGILLLSWACGGSEGKKDEAAAKKEKMAKLFGISVFELENGIGPIKEKLTLGSLDALKAAAGKKIFESKCSQCHKLDERYTGPAIRNVTKKRTPEYVLNNILNPEEMANKHPEAKKLVALHATKMTFQNVTQDDALKILEYFRSEEK
ncbi:MAG: cytochrome c [Melioribacteraceae bacterium]|jgi:mono/diheme cytochrome c family protein